MEKTLRTGSLIVAFLLFAVIANAQQQTSSTEPCPPDQECYERTALSGTLIRKIPEEKKPVLFLSPELSFGGTFSNYRNLGYFTYFDFGGGLSAIYNDSWRFKVHVRAMRDPHEQAGKPYPLWFVQPTIHAQYNVAHFAKYHYNFPVDLYMGIKIGGNVMWADNRDDAKHPNIKDESNFLYGIEIEPRIYFWQRMGIGLTLELSTIDYLKNFFLNYGFNIFYDFEIIGKPDVPKVDPPESAIQ